jgi:hypothetical protein
MRTTAAIESNPMLAATMTNELTQTAANDSSERLSVWGEGLTFRLTYSPPSAQSYSEARTGRSPGTTPSIKSAGSPHVPVRCSTRRPKGANCTAERAMPRPTRGLSPTDPLICDIPRGRPMCSYARRCTDQRSSQDEATNPRRGAACGSDADTNADADGNADSAMNPFCVLVAPAASPHPVEVEFVGRIQDVHVGIVGAAGDGVDGQESSGGGVVEADAHENQGIRGYRRSVVCRRASRSGGFVRRRGCRIRRSHCSEWVSSRRQRRRRRYRRACFRIAWLRHRFGRRWHRARRAGRRCWRSRWLGRCSTRSRTGYRRTSRCSG